MKYDRSPGMFINIVPKSLKSNKDVTFFSKISPVLDKPKYQILN